MRFSNPLAASWLGTLLLGAPLPVAMAQTSGPPAEWKLREDLRIGDGAGSGIRLPRIVRLIVGRDGVAYALSGTEILVFDRGGTMLRRVRALTDSAMRADLRRRALEQLDLVTPLSDRNWARNLAPAMGWLGDTLWFTIQEMDRIALLGALGEVVGSVSYSPDIGGAPANPPLALLADRSLLRSVTPTDAGPVPPARPMMPSRGTYRMPIVPGPPLPEDDVQHRGYLVRASPDGRVLQGLEIFMDRRPPITIRNQYGETRTVVVPFVDHPLVAVTPDGGEVVFVERYRAIQPGTASYSVARFDAATGRRSAHHHVYTPAVISRATVDSLLSRMVDSAGISLDERFLLGFPSRFAAKTAIRAALDVPAYHTPITDLVAGADRTVWLREHGSGRWLVLGRDGGQLGRVTLPAGARLMYADAECVWALIETAPGPARSRVLVRYRLLKQ